MTFAPVAFSSESDDAEDGATLHDRAVAMLMQEPAMVSRLLREHQMLHAAFEDSPVAATIHAPDGTLIAWNRLHDRLHPDGATPPDSAAQERDYGDEDGVYRTHDYALPGGATARVAVSIAGEKAQEAELTRVRKESATAIRAKADFLANMSHEIRTPMNGLLGMASLLAESGLSKGQQMYADVVLRSGEAMMAITDDILDLSKLESGQLELATKSFDVIDCIEDTAALFAAGADAKNVALITRIDPALPHRLIGDTCRLRQIVANLLGNAVKFTQTGHILFDLDAQIQTRDDGRRIARLTCRVEDTGAGIPADHCATIFDRFTEAHADTENSHQGTGLGLAVVQGLVTEMGGTIGVESVEGEGTTFHFAVELPVDAAGTVRRARDDLHDNRILIVAKDAARRAIITELVQAWGFEVTGCTSAQEAFSLLDETEAQGKRIDLILLGERIVEGEAALFTGALKTRTGSRPPVILMARLAALSMCDDDEGDGLTLAATLPLPVQSGHLLKGIETALRAAPARPCPKTETPGGDATVPATAERLDILVAEDNEINQMLIREILRETGYTYRIVGDGAQAVRAWRSDRPRLILMDVSMPAMSGDEATMQIRAEEEGRTRTPIVAVTAHALRGDRERCLRAGMDDHLTKPVTLNAVTTVIDSYLGDTVLEATA